MQLTTVPKTPRSLSKNRIGKQKFVELCALLIDDAKLTSGNQHAVEIAAVTYSEWRTLKDRSSEDLSDLQLVRAAARARSDYIKIITDLGMVKPEKKAPDKKLNSPLRIAPETFLDPDPVLVVRPKLIILKHPNADEPPADS